MEGGRLREKGDRQRRESPNKKRRNEGRENNEMVWAWAWERDFRGKGRDRERERKLFRWDVKKKKQDVKKWRKRKKQGAEKKKRVNHKNSDLQEWVGRRKEDEGKRKVQESDWRPSLRLEKRGYGSHCGPPSPLLLYFSSPRMPNSFLQPCVMFLPGNKHSRSNTHMHVRTQAHTHTSKRLAGTIRP